MHPLRTVLVVACTACVLPLSGCASWEQQQAEVAHDPNHKQYLTGSRLAYKGRGAPDAVKSVSAQDARDQMRTNIESRPQSQ
jgi:hypothetical protein